MSNLTDTLLDKAFLSSSLTGAVGGPPLLPSATTARELDELLARPARQRTKLWEFGTNLHCSIIGTCLTTAELRQIFVKLGRREAPDATEHDMHASAVLLAGKRHDGAKLLHKALDRRHRVAISQFDKAKTVQEVRSLWHEALKRGDVPGAYWAALTHPACNEALVREIFAEVHMLSHLVGASNRADIRRLRQLENDKATLEGELSQMRERLTEAMTSRDRALNDLRSREHLPPAPAPARGLEADPVLAGELKSRLARCQAHCEKLERQLADTRMALGAEQEARQAAEAQISLLQGELDAFEAHLATPESDEVHPRLDATLLYVGGRPAQVSHLREVAERAGAALLHHDGSIEDRDGLLPGLVSRADAVLFPVDRVSHTAVLAVKRLCRLAGKRLVPLRSTGMGPFCAASKALATGQSGS
ncbi:MAG: DUF2325 domain-containing protein [Alphaproteobacteria bacterium]|nr:DUF2325 domain-containing protein [Alphaproteobacteria bacterium]